MRIPEKFYELYQIESIQIRGKFYSKKNDVILINTYNDQGIKQEIVLKQYRQSNWSYNKEALILEYLKEKGLAVPQVYFKSNNLIIMEHIKGDLLLDVIMGQDEASPLKQMTSYKNIINNLSQWLKQFYDIMKVWKQKDYIKGDMNLRNFIYGDQLYGIDFENTRTGYMEKDIGRLCGFILSYAPEFALSRIVFVKELLSRLEKELGLNRGLTLNELKIELCAIADRRKGHYPEKLIEELVNKINSEQ